eukprot:Platyproteum_vivax@DN700_c0_g1_i1.p1
MLWRASSHRIWLARPLCPRPVCVRPLCRPMYSPFISLRQQSDSTERFSDLADIALSSIYDSLEILDSNKVENLSLDAGVLTIELKNQKGVFVLNKHAPSQQIWVSSPISGAHHFNPPERGDLFSLFYCPDLKCNLPDLIQQEYGELTGEVVPLI